MELSASLARECLGYDPDTGKLWRKLSPQLGFRVDLVGKEIRSQHKDGYLVLQIGRKKYLAHRVIWLIVNGEWPTGEIDHINRVRDDNRIENLRDVTKSVNQQNRTGATGVDFVKRLGKWRARITVAKRCRELGLYDTESEARSVYLGAKAKYHERCGHAGA